MARGISRYDEAAQQQRLWTPKDSGVLLALWLDTSDLSTVSCGTSGVSEWRDKSGNARNATQATDASRPVLTAIGLDNKSTIYHDGTDDLLTANYTYTGSDITVFIVSKALSGGGSNQRVLSFNRSNAADWSSNDTFFIGYEGGNNIRFLRNVTIVAASTITTRGTGNWALHSVTKTGGTATVSSNGETPVSGTTSTASFNFTRIQTGDGPGNYQGDLAEAIVIPSYLDQRAQELFIGYLAWKWGLVHILRAPHPFYSRPPTIGD
jgi:hypothetical protein